MFEWLKDKTYYKKKKNSLELEIELQRKTHAYNTIAWTKQIEELNTIIENKTIKLRRANKEIKDLKQRIKELETPKKGGKK